MQPSPNRKPFRILGFGLGALLLMVITACVPFNPNGKHPTDAKLTHLFQKNEEAFNKLVEMSNTDSNVIRIAYDFTRLETNWDWPRPEKQLGFSRERWSEYRTKFRKLSLESGLSRESNSNRTVILFTSSSKGMTFRGSSKGFAYSEQALSPIFKSLDQEESPNLQNEKHGIAYRKIKENWYLYFDW
jgi:hypothetical protein